MAWQKRLLILISFLLITTNALAAHDTTVTISPRITFCGPEPINYTVSVSNLINSTDNIREIRIYDDRNGDGERDAGIASLECGTPPAGWTVDDRLATYNYCQYETRINGSYKILPGQTLNFTFKAQLNDSSLQACGNEFKISSIDDVQPDGQVRFKFPQVRVDCTAPEVQKMVGTPKILVNEICNEEEIYQGTDNAACNYIVTQKTDFAFWGEDTEKDICNLGFDGEELDIADGYCRFRYTLNNGTPSDWVYFSPEGNFQQHREEYNFGQDSKHFVEIECKDIAGNVTTVTETDTVETMPPEFFPLDFEGPEFKEDNVQWIDGITKVILQVQDPQPHPTEVNTIFWRNVIVRDKYCSQSCSPCEFTEGTIGGCPDFNEVAGIAGINTLTLEGLQQSCNLLEYYAVDNIGNQSPTISSCFFVDKTPPELFKEVGQPSILNTNSEFKFPSNPGGEFHWVSPQTDITFTCEDQPPHPSGGEQLLFKVNYDLEGDITAKYCTSYGGIIENGWCVVGAEEDFVFNFNEKEDSVHTLEYFCRDAVDKKSNIEMQWYKVDSTKPVISKDMFGQFSGDCPSGTDLEHGDCYVADNESSGVNISAVDGIMQGAEMCVVGSVKCNYKVWWHTSEEMCDKKYDGERCLVEEGKFNEAGTNIIFNEDSTHDLEITCWDALRNQSEDTETFFVDSTPPVTTKTYGEPFFSCQNWCEEVCEYEGPGDCVYSCVNSSQCGGYDRLGHLYPQWINSTTPITLTAEDEKIGVDKIFWRNNIVPDYYCEQAYLCQPCEFTQSECGEFTEYNGPFFKGQESCHLIEYKSVDKFGNEEELKWQCTFVDNTSPEGIKEVGEPNVPCEEGQECDYFVSTRTPINLACTDGGNHPVNHETVNYRFSFHEDGEWTNSDWFMAEGSANVFFEEDSLHDLEFFCTDALGNTGVTDRELFFVDTVPPVITKTVVGPQIGTCPPQNEDDQTDGDGQTEGDEGDRCIIDGTTEIHVNAVDQEPHPVGNVTCTWGYEVVDDDQSNGVAGGIVIETRLTPPFTITFPEESKHLLWIECRDGLYNTVTDYEIFFVDKTPPKTIKVYGEPFIEMGGAEWISSVTPISLRATDSFGPHDTGVQATFYRTTIVNDAYCANEEDGFDCEAAEGSGNFLQYSGEPFNIPEQSCHLIEFYSVDGVEKTEKANKQCAFVDNTGPDAVKFVGEPKTQWDGRDSIFYPEIGEQCWQGENGLECWKVTLLTSVNMSCTDPEPHPVDSETIYFMAGLDGEDVTFDYCERYQGDFDEETGWCHVERSELEFFFFEETEHNLKFFCEDALGNRGEVDDEKFKVEGRPFEIQLNKKWNLISVPFVLLEDNPEIVFESVEENLDAVWNYDALSDQWFVFRPTENGSNNLESIETGDGYWIAMLEEDMLLIGGSLFSPITTPPDKPLKKGWNLIGYYGTDGMEGYFGPEENGKRARCALFSLGESFLDKGWTSLLSYWEPFNPNQWVEFNYLDRMDAGAGYWINASDEDSIYSYTTACKFLD